ncbi:MAG: GGDEF domain-containing protein [Lachnospiraceae bacterium]|nr:GGDEF domain-containing protein [Lachnospiraceae bacterium]
MHRHGFDSYRPFIFRFYLLKEKIGAIFIDIDFYKQCNDTYGHAKGDEIICYVARACKKGD